jgi:hypothetical protein
MMKRRAIILLYVAAALIVASCQRDETVTTDQTATAPTVTETTLSGPPQDLSNAAINTVVAPMEEIYADKSRLGSTVGQDGLVDADKTGFASQDKIYLSMWFKESPEGLQARAVVEDASGKEVSAQQKPMNGQKTVTFNLGEKKLPAGKYKVTGYWGGNIAAEHEFTVTAPPK